MSEKICSNCFFLKNEQDNDFSIEYWFSLDLDGYIESKKFNKRLLNKNRI